MVVDHRIGICPEFIEGFSILILPATGRCVQISHRCMRPKGVRHLLFTGRAIGGGHISNAATTGPWPAVP